MIVLIRQIGESKSQSFIHEERKDHPNGTSEGWRAESSGQINFSAHFHVNLFDKPRCLDFTNTNIRSVKGADNKSHNSMYQLSI